MYWNDRPVITSVASTADPIFYSADSTLLLNKITVLGNSEEAQYHRVFSYDKVLTQSEVLTMYDEAQIEPAVLDWNFNGNHIDTVNSIEFTNPYDIQIVDNKVVIDQAGPSYFLKADIPKDLVSKFSKTLMFRFKSLPGFSETINFNFSTYEGDFFLRNGIMVRIIRNNIQIGFYGTNKPDGGVNTLHSVYQAIEGFPNVIFDEFCHMVIVLDHTNNFITTYINGNLNSSTNALASDVTQTLLDQGTYYGDGATVPFFINKGSVWGDGNALYDDFKFFNKALTQEEVSHYYNLSLPPILIAPPPLVVIEPILHWDFETTWDNKQAVEFTNPFNIQLTDGKAVINRTGNKYYLRGNVPIELVSRFSKSLMFRFKSLSGFAGNKHFQFSTYEGNFFLRNGMDVGIVENSVRVHFNGTNSSNGAVKNLTSATHAIPGGLSTIYDNFVHLVVVFDHTDFSITTYINGNLNLSTIYVNANATQAELDQGTYFGTGETVPFFINKWTTDGDAMALYDDFKFFNTAITAEEVTHYYNESIA
jgi:hypothetical protein